MSSSVPGGNLRSTPSGFGHVSVAGLCGVGTVGWSPLGRCRPGRRLHHRHSRRGARRFPDGDVGKAYDAQLKAVGGIAPIHWKITSGHSPPD